MVAVAERRRLRHKVTLRILCNERIENLNVERRTVN